MESGNPFTDNNGSSDKALVVKKTSFSAKQVLNHLNSDSVKPY